ncbi:cAMP-dependent protein kinase regulatory subunit [Wickerhamomyces ciferrii]|uniref:cAMP-dependent protein kinase regulatory subunit n=1 Tax=Wickerhamomyces ciferrii (strain ATCC 14091 / BCRC 22168 / CBS 111 / JCM 3599 / NBRC 0793 / NRRL Y-1031 F-60-10) TaxID=1206466 RepID=K0KH04_WICCF|nr:cAMP-dependent protein kinase regulatory subunit [Wickerhamomyces ciferrii]CCH40669.1 cAMP-dependent protein kinase regulatory subunit [Wickerhamomyces ciferrii]
MSLPKDYINELNELNKEVQRKNPQDILQFCFNYFQSRLEDQRKQLWIQEPKARAAGISLFPGGKLTNIAEEEPFQRQPLFRNSFSNDDPHSTDLVDPHHNGSDDQGPGSNDIFKSGFHVGESNKSNIANAVDPHSSGPNSGSGSSESPSNFPTRRISHVTPGAHHQSVPQQPQQQGQYSQSSPQSQQQVHQQSPGPQQASSSYAGGFHNLPTTFNANRRTSVSAETFNPKSIKDDWKPPIIPKTQEQLTRLSNSVVKNFLFSSLDEDSFKTVINALEEAKYPAGTEVIRQGDEGDFFYVVETGYVQFFVDGKNVNRFGAGASFGELALMYNSPRAATAVAESDLVLWVLDRVTFRRILLAKTSKKRQLYESFLKEVPVLSRLSLFERSKLADALETESYKSGDVIIKEGEVGENFYLVENGEADVIKNQGGLIGHVKRGDYFGEVALLNDTPRQASIVAKTDVQVATLDKRGFQRLLGPAVEVLKRQDPTKH